MNEYLLPNIDLMIIILGWCISIYVLANKIENLEKMYTHSIEAISVYFSISARAILEMREEQLKELKDKEELLKSIKENPPPMTEHLD